MLGPLEHLCSATDNREPCPQASSDKPGIALGARGILVSCVQGKEAYAGREVCSLLNEVRLSPPR